MAKQTGTIGDLIFYKVGDHYYVRQKGSYNTKAVQKPGARPLMQLKQGEFGRASKLASDVYRLLPRAEKKHGLFGLFTKAARKLLQQGKTGEEVKAALAKMFLPAPPEAKPKTCGACTLSSWEVSTKGLLHKTLDSVNTNLYAADQQGPHYASTAADTQKRPETSSSLSLLTHDG